MQENYPEVGEMTVFLLEMAGLAPCRILDMGAGDGKTVRYLKSLGFDALGLDKAPGADVEEGDLLHTLYPDESFDAVIAECAFQASGDLSGAAKEAARLLKRGGMLLMSDVCHENVNEHIALLEGAGFNVLHVEDATPLWRELCAEAGNRGRFCLTICERK